MIVLLLNFLNSVSGLCPKITCGTYSSYLCGIFSEDSIQISPCLDFETCDILALHSSYQQGNTGLQCKNSQIVPESSSIADLMLLSCASSIDPGKRLNGTHPKQCNTNDDCGLIDGSLSDCQCGLSVNGHSFCEVSEGDDDYIAMKNAACDKNTDKFVWLLMKTSFFVFLQDRPACAGIVFEDIAAVDYLYAGGSITETVFLYSNSAILMITLYNML